jgi:hypothetical protein
VTRTTNTAPGPARRKNVDSTAVGVFRLGEAQDSE